MLAFATFELILQETMGVGALLDTAYVKVSSRANTSVPKIQDTSNARRSVTSAAIGVIFTFSKSIAIKSRMVTFAIAGIAFLLKETVAKFLALLGAQTVRPFSA